MQPPEKVRAFLTKYQDRVVYGTDLVILRWSDTPQIFSPSSIAIYIPPFL